MIHWLEIPGVPTSRVSALDAAVVVPGWGFSTALLRHVAWPAPRVWVAEQANLKNFAAELQTRCVVEGWEKVALCGWSLGARLALDFAAQHPQLVRALALVSLRLEFPAAEIAEQKRLLVADPVAYLTHFYQRCFVGQRRLAEVWLPRLCRWDDLDQRLPELLMGLDDLAARSIQPTELLAAQARLAHGMRDIIAPWKTWEGVLQQLPQLPCRRFPLSGHVPLLDDEFQPWLNEVWKLC